MRRSDQFCRVKTLVNPDFRGPVWSVWFFLILLWGCQQGPQLESVSPPKQLEEMGADVRRQFQERWDAVQNADQSDARTKSEAWGALGQWFQAYRFPESAAMSYRNAKKLDPAIAKWAFYLAMIELEEGDLETARSQFELALELDPDANEAEIELGEMASNMQDLERARGHYRNVLARTPDNPSALLGMAKYFLAKGDPNASIELLEKLLAQQPEVSRANYLMGTALVQIGEKEKAKAHFTKVPQDNNQHIPVLVKQPWTTEIQNMKLGSRIYTKKGLQALEKGDINLAASLLERAVTDDPTNPEIKVNYAILLEKVGRLDLAKAELDGALALDPDNFRAHLVLGRLGVNSHRLVAAEKHLKRALEIDANATEAQIQMGKLWQIQKRYDEALEYYGLARKVNRPLVGTRFWYSAILSFTEGIDQALTAVGQDLALLPEERSLRLLRLRFLVTVPGEKRQVAAARAALEGFQNEPDVYYAETAAMVAAAAGDFQTAIDWEKAALKTLTTLRARKPAQVARRRLILYQRGEPCETPWEADEASVTKSVDPPERLP